MSKKNKKKNPQQPRTSRPAPEIGVVVVRPESVVARRPLLGLARKTWGALVIAVGLISGLIAFIDAEAHLAPEVSVESQTSAPTQFRIRNGSFLFSMREMSLTCDATALVDTNAGRMAFGIPVSSGETNMEVARLSEGHYPCDAMLMLSVTADGRLCFGRFCQERSLKIDPASLKLATETIQIDISYGIAFSKRNVTSQLFEWDGRQWHIGEQLK